MKNKDKRIDKWLTILEMSAKRKGIDCADIAHVTGYHIDYIPKLISQYRDGGIEAITGNHYHRNRRNMSVEEESAVLRPFQEDRFPPLCPSVLSGRTGSWQFDG